MARQQVDIGVEGNDGTGDSIRESFRKVNENFREIYAVVGKGGQISFTSLADTPDSLSSYEGGNRKAFIPIVKQDATGIDIWELASDSADPNATGTNIVDTVEFVVTQTGKLIVKVANIQVIKDSAPTLGGPLNAAGLAIGNIGTEEADASAFNRIHGTAISADDLVIDKKFADKNYIARQNPGETINVPDEPVDASAYTKAFSVLVGQNKANISAHGLTRGSDGAPYIFNTTGAGINWQKTIFDAVAGEFITQSSTDVDEDLNPIYGPIVDGDTVYIGILDQNNIGFWLEAGEPLLNDSAERERLRLKLSPIDAAQLTITDAGYDETLQGFYLSQQVLPRNSVVRRQGDTMSGALILHDHPGDLAGAGTPKGLDDLQAVSKLYVDSQSTESSANIFVSTSGDDLQRVAPPGKEGSSLAYAYRTVGAAARKAEAVQRASPFEPGPYMQDIISSRTIDPLQPPRVERSRVTSLGIPTAARRQNTRTIIDANLDFIVAEVLGWVEDQIINSQTTTLATITVNWTGRVIDTTMAEVDLTKAIAASTLDYLTKTDANFLSNRAGIEYYNDEYTKSQAGLVKQVFATMVERARTVLGAVIEQATIAPNYQTLYEQQFISFGSDVPNSTDSGFVAGTNGTMALQRNIISNGVFTALQSPVVGTRYKLYFTNTVNGVSENGWVDQGNPQNRDLRVGKVIRGKISGAIGRVISYYPGNDIVNNVGSEDDVVELELLRPVDFIQGENLEMGNIVNERNITIKIETGTYYEDYPIRVPVNVSLVGDEFRRVHIRPLNRTSQSPWANIYFYRDKQFDGLTGDNDSITGYPDTNLPFSGEQYINPLTGEIDGYFGRHYLVKPASPKNVDRQGQLAFTNAGQYINAAILVEKNKAYVQAETIAFIKYRIQKDITNTGADEGFQNVFNPEFTSNTQAQDRYRNLVSKVIDAVVVDLRTGGNFNVLSQQAEIYFELQEYTDEKAVFAGVLTNMKQMLDDMVQNVIWVDNFVAPYRDSLHPVQYTNLNLEVESGIIGDGGILDNQFTLLDFAIEPNVTSPETNYNCAKRSTDLDVFLMNDATILRNMSVQGHGGFMCVLDPDGQVLTKSPYIQTGSSFSQSLNRQAFRGGMLVDAFAANTPMEVVSKDSNFILNVQGANGSGLYTRKPQTPAPFYINGIRYQVNDIINYDNTSITGPAIATLILDISSGPVDPNDLTNNLGFTIDPEDPAYEDGYPITLQTAGNRSMLGNDFTQVNDLGYGLVTINGGLSEMVSMFTYYCHTAYYAGNGGQIRSLNGSNANGVYGLVAEGSDPNEVPDDVILVNDMIQGAKTFSTEIILILDDNITVAVGDTITCTNNTGEGTVVYPTVGNRVFINGVTGTYAAAETLIVNSVTTSPAITITDIDTTGYSNVAGQLSMYFYEVETVPTNKGEIEYYHDDDRVDAQGDPLAPLNRIARYELASLEKVSGITIDGYTVDSADLGTVGAPTAWGSYTATSRTGAESDPVAETTYVQFDITKVSQNGGTYKIFIDPNAKGDYYKIGDTFVIKGSKLGGTDTTHDATLTVTAINQSAINEDLGINTGSVRSVSISGTVNVITGYTPQRDGQVYKANFSTSNDTFNNDGLLSDVPENKPLIVRQNNTHTFGEIESAADLTIRPSTAVNFQEDFAYTYRSISFGSNDAAGNELAFDQALTGFDASYDWIRLNVASERIDAAITEFDAAQMSVTLGGTTVGGTIGDTTVAINTLSEVRDIWRINNNFLTNINYRPTGLSDGTRDYDFTGELPKVIVWAGKKHYVYNYREISLNTVSGLFNDERKSYSENNLFALVDLLEISEVTLPFGETVYNSQTVPVAVDFARIVSYSGGIAEAKVRQNGNRTAYGTVKIAGTGANQVKLYNWSGVNFNTTGYLEIWEGDPADPDPDTGSWTILRDQNNATVIPDAQVIRDANITDQASGIAAPIEQGFTGTITLRAGLQDGSPAKVTIDISTCRATGHDFLDIGTGSFNASNYPNVILGFPAALPLQENEIDERNKGRVFYVSTDQDGFFRVGRFFTVDQGTGTVTFAASIALSDVDGIGFKRGVVVTEFSTDSSMADNADDTVPVESAVRGYVNRRLGYDQAGNAVPNPLGPSVLTQNGAVAMTGNLKMNGNTILNIAPVDIATTAGTTAVNKNYVDLQTQEYSKITDLRDVEIKGGTTNEFLGLTNTKTMHISAEENDLGDNATFAIGMYLTNEAGTANFGRIVGNVAKTDISLGNVIVVSFEVGPDSYNTVEPGENPTPIYDGDGSFDGNGNLTAITTAGTRSGVVFAGPYNEVINISEEPFNGSTPVSDIALTTRRLTNDDISGNGVLDIPTAYFNLQINDEVIVNSDVNPNADILQSKLYLKEADNFVITALDVPVESITTITVGYSYRIVAIGDTTQANWNTAAGTTGVTYAANSLFTAAVTNVGAATTGTVKREIATSTLPRAASVTRQNNQATLGLSSFDMANFKVTRGYVQLKDNGIPIAKIQKIASDTVLGNSTATSGNISEVTFSTVVDEGNGLQHSNFNFRNSTDTLANPVDYASAGVLFRTGADAYEVQPVTSTGVQYSLVKTDAGSGITATSYKIGTGTTPTVLKADGTLGLVLTNIQGGTILTASGTNDTKGFGPIVNVPGSLNIGRMGNPTTVNANALTPAKRYEIISIGTTNFNTAAGTTGITYVVGDTFVAANTGNGTGTAIESDVFSRSSLQNSSASFTTSPWVAADWIYSSFIESPREKGTATTGIAIGFGSDKAAAGEIAILTGDSNNNTSPIPFKFSKTGVVPDSDSTYEIGTDTLKYKKLYVDSIKTDGSIVVGDGVNTQDNNGLVDSLYTIRTLGTTNWNTLAGTTGVTYTAGDIVRVAVTQNGTGTLNAHQFVFNDATGDGYFARDVIAGRDLHAYSIVNRNTDGFGSIGASNKKFASVYATTFYGTATQAQYADLAENYLGDAEYAPGTVLVFGGDEEVTVTDKKGDHRVAGVVTTNPAHLMNSHLEGNYVVGVALQGRVPVNVIGKVEKGDILITSAIPGYAVVNNAPAVGTIIGKAVGVKSDDGRGIVEVVVGRV